MLPRRECWLTHIGTIRPLGIKLYKKEELGIQETRSKKPLTSVSLVKGVGEKEPGKGSSTLEIKVSD